MPFSAFKLAMAPKLLLAVILLALAIATSSAFPRFGGLGEDVQYVIPESVIGNYTENPMNDSLDSAAVHRSLMWTRERYISYTAMRKNNIPCSRRGASYYNCRPGKAVNPYHRGCSRITNCARTW